MNPEQNKLQVQQQHAQAEHLAAQLQSLTLHSTSLDAGQKEQQQAQKSRTTHADFVRETGRNLPKAVGGAQVTPRSNIVREGEKRAEGYSRDGQPKPTGRSGR